MSEKQKPLFALLRDDVVGGMMPALMLRTRLFLNLAPFVILLLGIGIYAIILFARITENVDVTVTGNYRGAQAAQQMKLSIRRMEEGVLLAMDDNNKGLGHAVFEQNRRTFDENLGLLIKNSRTPTEKEMNRRLTSDYDSFKEAGNKILSLDKLDIQRKAFQSSLMPELLTIDGQLDTILQRNDQAILATTQRVQNITGHATRLMIVCILVAMTLAGYACYKLARSIFRPIQSLTKATAELGKGNLDQLVPVTARDELGDLADAFNKMAAQLRAYRQSTAEKIVRMHRTMESTLASFPDPIFVLDRDGVVELMNPAAMELATVLELDHALPERLQETAHKALKDGESYLPHSFKEVVSFRLYGKEKFFLPRVLTMRDEKNLVFGVAVVLHDVTRFRLLDDAKTNLVSTVSHEIKTPLTSVRMVLHLLLEKTIGPLTPRQNEMLVTARDDAERLLTILNDLLDLTRLEEGNNDLYKEMTRPAELIQNVADIMREALKAKELKLTCHAESDLPPVLVDRQRINHVFSNLLNNAIKYSPVGGEIVLCAERAADHEVQFSVRDMGPGVPEDYQDRIFDRFYRVPEQTKTGAGLGLSIAREIVVAHGGRIGVRNRPDRGSEFYFVLAGGEGDLLF